MITVAGLSPSLDLTYVVPTLRLGAITRPVGAVRCAGGKPLNLARSAARLGGNALVVAVLGGVTGDYLEQALGSDRVAVSRVETEVETRICVSIAAEDTEQLTEVYEYAAPLPDPVWAEFDRRMSAALRERPGWLAVSGGPPRDLDPAALADLVTRTRAIGVAVAVDTHGPALPVLLETGPELVKINRAEAAEVCGAAPDAALSELAAQLAARTGGTVVLTDGVHGAVSLSPEGLRQIAPPPTLGRYPVGSGDAFLGGLLAGLDGGSDFLTAVRTASAAAAANAYVPGPGRFDPAEVAALAGRVELRPL